MRKAPSSFSVHPSSSINHRHSQMCHRLSFTSSLFVICGFTPLYFLSGLGQKTSPVFCPSGIMIVSHEDLIKFDPMYPNLCAQQSSYSIEWILRSSSVQAEPRSALKSTALPTPSIFKFPPTTLQSSAGGFVKVPNKSQKC